MTAFNYKKWNTILGWGVFVIALITYILTVEPTMSFWDCGEYIATATKLQVGHPPGAPLFQMIGAFLSMFAFNKTQIAVMVNMISVISSAFTILFLFWSSTIILKKIIGSYTELTTDRLVVLLGSSVVGSLTLCFSDTFWFNAVEAEVYAMATFMIALLFWLGLRWEAEMDNANGNRWLLLISLVVGLSFGVHFMALLTIPSIGFLYFFKKYEKVTIKNFILANVIVVALLFFVFKFLVPYVIIFVGKTEIFMVNNFGLPFNTGTIFAFSIIIGLFFYGLFYTKAKGLVQFNTIILCMLFVLIGFSNWLMLPIRANSSITINENKPSNAADVLDYYNREQYGSNSLVFGPQYTDEFAGLDPANPYLDGVPNYEKDDASGKYIIVNNFKNSKQNTDDKQKAFLPRMWSTDHIENYINLTEAPKFTIKDEYTDAKELTDIVAQFREAFAQKKIDSEGYVEFLKVYGEYLNVEKPSFWSNISFMVEYQFGYMYGRYLLWNFVGKQNDNQGKYDNQDGNWLSGIKFIDELHLGTQNNLPSDALNNKGRNTYFFLPFILGLIGMMYHAQRNLKSFYVVLALFLFTGIALKIYLNERPFEPRERDYAVVGSFYIFALWVGFGVFALYEIIAEKFKSKLVGPVVIGLCILSAPVLMASQNWNDHDRSNKYTAIASAKSYLDSCAPNAILYTIGDNDTFPLWYAQEVEGYRTDVKVCCTSLLMTDWYIDQMKFKTYKADGLPISFQHKQYVDGTRDGIILRKQIENRWELKNFLNFAKKEDSTAQVEIENGQKLNFLPTNKVRYTIDKNAVIANKAVNPKYNDSIVPFMDFDIKGGAIYKNRLIMLDILQNNNWKRPIYFSGGSFAEDDYLWMKDYLQLDGVIYKLVPLKTKFDTEKGMDMGRVDSESMYKIIMKWDWGNSESSKIYHDPETRRNAITYRTNMARLMEQLINEGQKDKAKKIIDLVMAKIPFEYYTYYSTLDPFAEGYYAVGEKQKARNLITKLMGKYTEQLNYFAGFSASEKYFVSSDIQVNLYRFKNLVAISKNAGDNEFYDKCKIEFFTIAKRFEEFGSNL